MHSVYVYILVLLTNKNVRLIAINHELTHDNHAINRDEIFVSIDSPTIYIYILLLLLYILLEYMIENIKMLILYKNISDIDFFFSGRAQTCNHRM